MYQSAIRPRALPAVAPPSEVAAVLAHRVGVVIDPDRYGFDEATLIRLSIEPRHAAEAMETLANYDEIASLSHVLGRFNIFAVANTRSDLPSAELFDQLIAELPGVNEALVSPIRQTYKHDHTLARITAAR